MLTRLIAAIRQRLRSGPTLEDETRALLAGTDDGLRKAFRTILELKREVEELREDFSRLERKARRASPPPAYPDTLERPDFRRSSNALSPERGGAFAVVRMLSPPKRGL